MRLLNLIFGRLDIFFFGMLNQKEKNQKLPLSFQPPNIGSDETTALSPHFLENSWITYPDSRRATHYTNTVAYKMSHFVVDKILQHVLEFFHHFWYHISKETKIKW